MKYGYDVDKQFIQHRLVLIKPNINGFIHALIYGRVAMAAEVNVWGRVLSCACGLSCLQLKVFIYLFKCRHDLCWPRHSFSSLTDLLMRLLCRAVLKNLACSERGDFQGPAVLFCKKKKRQQLKPRSADFHFSQVSAARARAATSS